MNRLKTLFVAVAGFALLMLARTATAGPTLVSTINGYYDVDGYDTPSLHIANSTAFDFTNVTLTATGYQGLNNGVSQTISLPNIVAGSTFVYVWGGSTTPGNMFAYDYDDEWGNTPGGYTNSACVVTTSLCSDVGNFYITFTAVWNGQNIYAQFSPGSNATGGFVGWEGLDPNGVSETSYDSHNNGGPNGVLANIYVGTPPPLTTPEPGSVLLLLTGAVGLFGFARRYAA